MRIYGTAEELISEIFRDLDEMGTIVKPRSYQNKDISGNPDFITKELQMYVYGLVALPDPEVLFLFEGEKAKDWCLAEFQERIDFTGGINPGEAWKIRQDVWEQFLVNGKFDYTYNQRLQFNSNLHLIIHELKRNPGSRQCWLPIFNPDDVGYLGGKKRIPCSLGYHFMVRDGKLSMTYVQRSADAVQHFGNDIYLAWMMKEWVAKQINVEPGYLFHNIFSLHSYRKDWGKLKKGISKLI